MDSTITLTGSINTGLYAHNCIFEKTMHLRWYKPLHSKSILQQASICTGLGGCGRIEWENIPIAEEEDF